MLQPSLITPIIRLLRLPRPLHPPSPLLIGNSLRLPILPQEPFVIPAKTRSRPRLGRTIPSIVGITVGSVIACTAPASVEVLCAIGGSGRPFADDHPEVEGREAASLRTGGADVLVVGVGDLVVGEHLVDVDIHGYTGPRLISTGHEAVPVVETFERVVDQNDGVALRVKGFGFNAYIHVKSV